MNLSGGLFYLTCALRMQFRYLMKGQIKLPVGVKPLYSQIFKHTCSTSPDSCTTTQILWHVARLRLVQGW